MCRIRVGSFVVGGDAEHRAGDGQARGDAAEGVQARRSAKMPFEGGDIGLAQSGQAPDLRLARARVLTEETDDNADVTRRQSLGDLRTSPETLGNG
jgi:hypothetical protein